MSRRAGLLVGAVVGLTLLAGCGWGIWDDAPDLAEDDRSAHEALYAEPLFAEPPPGAGDLLGEDFSMECDEGGYPPSGGHTWVLLDDGLDAVAYYKRIGEESGWGVVEESAPDPDAPFGTREASLQMEKSSNGYIYGFSVLIGHSSLHDEIEVGAHGGIDAPDVCRSGD